MSSIITPHSSPTTTGIVIEPRSSRGEDEVSLPNGRVQSWALLAYVCWVAYSSLFPLAGWTSSGISSWAFLSAEWPRYWTLGDVGGNVLLYLPVGFLAALWRLRSGSRAIVAVATGIALASGLGISVEYLQNWLPTRVASNLDWLTNTLGGLVGATAAVFYQSRWAGALSTRWKAVFLPGKTWGSVLVLVWVVMQVNPAAPLFQTGWPAVATAFWDTNTYLFWGEVAATALQTLAAVLLAFCVLHDARLMRLLRVILGAMLVLAVKALLSAYSFGLANGFIWLTNGAIWGVLLAAVAATALVWASQQTLRIILVLALLAGVLVGAFIPASPYAAELGLLVRESPLRNLGGGLGLLSMWWPLFVLLSTLQPELEKRNHAI